MTITAPPRPPHPDDPVRHGEVEALVEALIEEARRRARRRRQRTLVVVLAAMLGALWLYSHLGTGGAGSEAVVASGTPGASASRPKATLPEELSFSANRGVVLVRRDGTRRPFVSEIIQPHAGRHRPFYNGLDWSPDGSKLLTLRGGNGFGRALVVTDKTGKVISTLDSRALDGGWSTDGTRIAFVRYEEGLGRLLFVASSDGRAPTRIAAHVKSFGYPAFSWSPHGTKLAYAPQGASGLMIADATGHRDPRPVPIATGAGAPGLKIATVQWSPRRVAHRFHLRRRSVRHARRLARQRRPPGRHIVPPGGRRGRLRLVARRQAARDRGDPREGRRLRGQRRRHDLHRIVGCRCDLRGEGSGPSVVAWSLDGTRIAYISGRPNTVGTIRPDGTRATVVATQAARGPGGPGYPFSLLWRPPGAR